MKKLFITMMTVLLVSALLSAVVFAADHDGDNGAYCTPEKQHELAGLLRGNADLKKEMDLYGFDVLEESISPKYYVDLYEYAKTGKLDVVRLCKWKDDGSMDETKPCYYAMLITKENEYAGGIIFWSDGKTAEYGPFELTAKLFNKYAPADCQKKSDPVSCSYADYAEHIMSALGLVKFVAPENVKYVSAEGLRGTALFLVSVDNKEYAIPVDESYPTEHTGDNAYISVTDGGLKAIADQALTEHNEYLAMIEQVRAKWEEEHPGEPFVPIGGDGLLTIDFAEVKTNRIINISDYLKTGVSARTGENDGIADVTTAETDGIVYALGETSAEDNGTLPLIIGICAAAVVVTVAAVIIVRKKKTKV